MKTATEMRDKFNEETGLNYLLSDEKYRNWLEKQVRELHGQNLRYKEFYSQPNQLKQVEEWDTLCHELLKCISTRTNGSFNIEKWITKPNQEKLNNLFAQHYSAPKDSGKELSEITDEDAIEVAKMFPKDGYPINSETGKRLVGGIFNISMKHNGCILAMMLFPRDLVVFKIYQYLQSKGYKLPKYF